MINRFLNAWRVLMGEPVEADRNLIIESEFHQAQYWALLTERDRIRRQNDALTQEMAANRAEVSAVWQRYHQQKAHKNGVVLCHNILVSTLTKAGMVRYLKTLKEVVGPEAIDPTFEEGLLDD